MPRPIFDTMDPGTTDRNVITNLKRLTDYTGNLENLVNTLQARVDGLPKPLSLDEIKAAVRAQTAAQIAAAGPPTGGTTPTPVPGPGTPPGPANTDMAIAHPAGIPGSPNLRFFRANMCGIRVPGLPAVAGGAADPTLFLTWFYDRYGPADRATIRAAYIAKGYTHFHLSWCDSRDFGTSVATYVSLAQELAADGLYVGHFWCGKDQDTGKSNATIMASVSPVIAALQAAGGVLPWSCVGWELSLWRTPTEVQDLIDQQAALMVPASNLYVHFQSDYIAFQQPGGVTADFWNLNVGKLTGLLHQKLIGQDDAMYQARIDDGLTRFAGNDGFPTDSGFGHPFDYITYEVSASTQFAGGTEAAGDAAGYVAMLAPAQTGPAGTVAVNGFGNGISPLV